MKGRKQTGPFVALPCNVIDSARFARLSGSAVKLLVHLMRQYNGRNNGDLQIAWTRMREWGWRSKTTLYAALGELIDNEFVLLTRQGGLHACSLYAVRWLGIDFCSGKLSIPVPAPAPGGWDKPVPAATGTTRQRVQWANPKRRSTKTTLRLVQNLDQ